MGRKIQMRRVPFASPLSSGTTCNKKYPKRWNIFPPLPTHVFFWNLCRRYDTDWPRFCRNFAQRNLFPAYTAYITVPLAREREGGGAVTRGNEIFFYSLPSKIQSYFYLTTEEMKTFWPPSRPSTTTTVLPYCANRNIIEIRIPNSGKQFLESKTLILLLCWCWGKRGKEIKKESPIPPRRVEIPPPLNFSVTETTVNFRADNGKDPRRGSVRSFSVERDTVERVLQ